MSSSSRPDYRVVARGGLDRPGNGVTVVVASHRRPQEAIRTLRSLADQTLNRSRFEVVVVVNGPAADDVAEYHEFVSLHPDFDIRFVASPLAGVCHALNLGIQSARMPWVTFVDDDDLVSPGFLEGLLSVAGPGVIPLTVIHDVQPDGTVTTHNRINDQIQPHTGKVVPPEDCPRGLSFTAAKLVPTDWARATLFDNRLTSGQDVAFFGRIYARYDFDFAIVPDELESVYLRSLSDSSLSRRDLSFEFAVDERLDVIQSMAEGILRTRPAKRPLLTTLMRAQALFIRSYLDSEPAERNAVNSVIRQRGLTTPFPWDVITRGKARTLVVSVCFPPFSDASSVTVAKRIFDSGSVVDVVSADMSAVRSEDPSLNYLVAGLVGVHTVVPSRVGFGDWGSARNFSLEGWNSLEQRLRRRWPYEALYSRAMWPASHVLAALVKTRHPETRWTAEFSDPLSRTVQGAVRLGEFETDELVDELMAGAADVAGGSLPPAKTVFDAAETLAYALAEELVFTNGHQLDYMLRSCPSRDLADLARSKAVVSSHPVPAPEFYHLVQANGPPEPGRVCLAYFGNFYANRSVTDLFAALAGLPLAVRRRLRLDIYTEDRTALERVIAEMCLFDVISILSPVPYLTFLNLTTQYDCLVVNDTATASTHGVNPYLPSKWSDYAGSGTAIWKIVEPESTLASLPSVFTSQLGDVAGAGQVLLELARKQLDRPLMANHTRAAVG